MAAQIAHRSHGTVAHTDKRWILIRLKAAIVFKLKQMKSNLKREQIMTYDRENGTFLGRQEAKLLVQAIRKSHQYTFKISCQI